MQNMTDPIRLEPGQTAPDFTLLDQNGESLTLSSLRGQKVIVYFYPEAMTPGCTTQACDFRDNLNQLNDRRLPGRRRLPRRGRRSSRSS